MGASGALGDCKSEPMYNVGLSTLNHVNHYRYGTTNLKDYIVKLKLHIVEEIMIFY